MKSPGSRPRSAAVAARHALAACGSSREDRRTRRRPPRVGRADAAGGAGRRHHADQVVRALDRRRQQRQGRSWRSSATRSTCSTPRTTSRPRSTRSRTMITKGAKVLIIASIDGTALTTQLQEAADNKIPVIAYDRLIRDSPNVDYYATFDNFKVGVQQADVAAGRARRSRTRTAPTARPRARSTSSCSPARPTTTTPRSSSTARCRVLQPYIDNGTLVVKSGQTDFEQVAILRWDAGHRAEADGGPAHHDLQRRRQGRRRALARTTACRSASSRR